MGVEDEEGVPGFSWEVYSWILRFFVFFLLTNTLIALMSRIRSKDYSDEMR